MSSKIKVTVWNEFLHEKNDVEVAKLYPNGMHEVIADFLRTDENFLVTTKTLDMPEHGLTDEVLDNTDVLIWWGHIAHDLVDDAIAQKVAMRVNKGMGLIVLHSGHFSKPFRLLMGTECDLCWREVGEKERIWNVSPSHPIAKGIAHYFELEHEEMYGEFFKIPAPDETVFISWFAGGEVFRSGICFNRGYGKVFYFRPGHESYPTYYDKNVEQVIKNAVYYLKPAKDFIDISGQADPLEKI